MQIILNNVNLIFRNFGVCILMKKLTISVLITIFLFSYAKAQDCRNPDLFSVQKENKYGFINREGKIIIPLKFDSVGEVSEGLIAVEINKKWGYMNKKGKIIIKPQFDWASSFHGGLARIELNYLAGFINKKGEIVIQP